MQEALCSVACEWPRYQRLVTIADVTEELAGEALQLQVRRVRACAGEGAISTCDRLRSFETARQRYQDALSGDERIYDVVYCDKRARYRCGSIASHGGHCRRIIDLDFAETPERDVSPCAPWEPVSHPTHTPRPQSLSNVQPAD